MAGARGRWKNSPDRVLDTAFLANSDLALGTCPDLGHSGNGFQALTSAEASNVVGRWGFPHSGVICNVLAVATRPFLPALEAQMAAQRLPSPRLLLCLLSVLPGLPHGYIDLWAHLKPLSDPQGLGLQRVKVF